MMMTMINGTGIYQVSTPLHLAKWLHSAHTWHGFCQSARAVILSVMVSDSYCFSANKNTHFSFNMFISFPAILSRTQMTVTSYNPWSLP